MHHRNSITRHTLVLLLLSLLIIGGYANVFQAAWHLDDKPNILNNIPLHIDNLHPQTLKATLFAHPKNPYEPSKRMYRPVACLSFALNWYFGQADTVGYRAVNVLFHILNAFFLYVFIRNLYKTPVGRREASGSHYLVPVLAATLWAVNPIQTQAVTYIVQRMAVLGAMFYLLGMLAYLKGRLTSNTAIRLVAYGAAFCCYLLAMGSKENTLLFPLTLVIMEFAFFRDLRIPGNRRSMIVVVVVLGAAVMAAGSLLFLKGDPFTFLKAYAYRPFSLTERILTECRVIVHYLTQIFYPLPARLSIEHDVMLSVSLTRPLTTLPAAIFLILWASYGFWLLGRRPLIGFSLIFFLINHLIESSVIPLELMFEHRNYLPSLLLFIPVAMGMEWLLNRCGHRKPVLKYFMWALIGLVVVGLVSGTRIRNRVWSTERSLWQDAAIKAPLSARPFANLAWDMAYGVNADPRNYANALKLYELALQRHMPKWGMQTDIMINVAGIHARTGDNQKAIHFLTQALQLNPDNAKARYDLATLYLRMGRWDDASRSADPLLLSGKVHEGYLNLKAFILIRQGHPEKAIPYLQKSLLLEPNFQTTLIYLGTAHNLAGHHEKAEKILENALNTPPLNLLPLVCLMDNSLRSGNKDRASRYADLAARMYADATIRNFFEKNRKNNLIPPLLLTDISQLLFAKLNGTDQ